jgi:RNA polymerase sigma-70 factor (ECF subfamily)
LPSILQRIADGDPDAVQDCLDAYGGLIWSMARRQGLPQEEAEDVVQEIFIDLWKSADRYDEKQASETTFVGMIARRRLIDRRRRQQRRPPHDSLVPEERDFAGDGLERLENTAEVSVVRRAIAELRPEEQRALYLSTYQGMSHGQIAEHTGIPLGTVKTYIRRGLLRVQEILERKEGGERREGSRRTSLPAPRRASS